MHKRLFLFALLFLFSCILFAQNDTVIIRKEYITQSALPPPKIDGVLDDAIWQNVAVVNDLNRLFLLLIFPQVSKQKLKLCMITLLYI